MNEEAGFRRAIHDNPHDFNAHYAYADWLADRGREDDARFRRAMGDWFYNAPNHNPFMDNAERADPEHPHYDRHHTTRPFAVLGHLVPQLPGAAELPSGVDHKLVEYSLVDHPGMEEHRGLWTYHPPNHDNRAGHASWKYYGAMEDNFRRAFRDTAEHYARRVRRMARIRRTAKK